MADNAHDMVAKGRHLIGRMIGANKICGDANGSRLHPERLDRGKDHWANRMPERIPRGYRHSSSKLNPEAVAQIRSLRGHVSSSALARRFRVGGSTIKRCWRGKTYREVAA
jgi:hypothetical protein